jgi:hypothetical protein
VSDINKRPSAYYITLWLTSTASPELFGTIAVEKRNFEMCVDEEACSSEAERSIGR